jgi:hypothetical protein
MASWALVPALTGFAYSAVDRHMTFARAAAPVRWFWSTGNAWGASEQRPVEKGLEVTLQVLGGTLAVEQITIRGVGSSPTGHAAVLARGEALTVVVPSGGSGGSGA